jgi:ribosomal protein L31
MSNEDVFITKSTADTKETITVDLCWIPSCKMEISRTSPFYTGKTNLSIPQDVLINSKLNTLNTLNNFNLFYYIWSRNHGFLFSIASGLVAARDYFLLK